MSQPGPSRSRRVRRAPRAPSPPRPPSGRRRGGSERPRRGARDAAAGEKVAGDRLPLPGREVAEGLPQRGQRDQELVVESIALTSSSSTADHASGARQHLLACHREQPGEPVAEPAGRDRAAAPRPRPVWRPASRRARGPRRAGPAVPARRRATRLATPVTSTMSSDSADLACTHRVAGRRHRLEAVRVGRSRAAVQALDQPQHSRRAPRRSPSPAADRCRRCRTAGRAATAPSTAAQHGARAPPGRRVVPDAPRRACATLPDSEDDRRTAPRRTGSPASSSSCACRERRSRAPAAGRVLERRAVARRPRSAPAAGRSAGRASTAPPAWARRPSDGPRVRSKPGIRSTRRRCRIRLRSQRLRVR